MIVSSVAGIAINIATIAAAYGLLKRMKWGRISFIYLVWVQTIFYFVTMFATYSMAQSFLGGAGIDQAAGGSSIIAMGEVAGIVGGLLVIAFAIFIVRKLSSVEVRQEFDTHATSLSIIKTP